MISIAARSLGLIAAATLAAGPLAAAPAEASVATEGKVLASVLTVRYAPTTHSTALGSFTKGKVIPLSCKVVGPSVDGNNIWYSLPPTTHEWVSARYVQPLDGTVPWCRGLAKTTGQATVALSKRTGPSTLNARVGSYAKGATFTIICKVNNQRVDGNNLWYWTSEKRWVSARYVKNVDKIPTHCSS